ncbi:MAG TPA: Uma2 family endonuclease [Symbiobacteriaceae bacterium]|nr:Uma2 family endonuclease [Symbiobacteriaceae bacterium]
MVHCWRGGGPKRDRGIKRHVYGRHGVREYWIVDPDALTVEVIVNQDGHMETWGLLGAGDRVESPVLRGLDLKVDELLDKPAK